MDDKKTISDLVAETKEPDATPIDFGCGEEYAKSNRRVITNDQKGLH